MVDQRDDIEFELEERDAEYARQVLQGVRYIEHPEGEEEQQEQEEQEEQEQQEHEEHESRHIPLEEQNQNMVWLLLSGNVLLLRGFTKYYGQLVVVAAVFLLSIFVMFWSLHLDMQYNALVRDVQLLRERSVRLQEVRFSRCSHSSIVEELERRGIDLSDSTTPATVIENKKFW